MRILSRLSAYDVRTASAVSTGVAFSGNWGKALGRAGPFLVGSSRDAGENGSENKPLLTGVSLSGLLGVDEPLGVVGGVNKDASYDE